ncbi:MAG: hypothetical protein K6U14_05280 [Firmicutes bacterium]|nr:hypothetical protein [Alicyclobacillaceae bacterium]MCL6497031.1 hypothetical protein [Bacillota bacterium]
MNRRASQWPKRFRSEARAPAQAPVPVPTERTPDPRIQVEVTAATPRRPWRVGRTAWRAVLSLLDWALLALVLGIVAWALGQLALRHYLPPNPLTDWLGRVSQWEGHAVMDFWQRGGTGHG